MKKKKYAIRLYTVHDKDLIALHSADFKIVQAVYLSLRAFLRGQRILIYAPCGDNPLQKKKRCFEFSLYLDTEVDKDMIEMLEKIAPGARNNFLKNLTRLYLCRPVAEGYIEDEESRNFFEEHMKVLRENRKVVSLKKKKKTIRTENIIPAPVTDDKSFDMEEEIIPAEEEKENLDRADTESDNISRNDADELTSIFSSLI